MRSTELFVAAANDGAEDELDDVTAIDGEDGCGGAGGAVADDAGAAEQFPS